MTARPYSSTRTLTHSHSIPHTHTYTHTHTYARTRTHVQDPLPLIKLRAEHRGDSSEKNVLLTPTTLEMCDAFILLLLSVSESARSFLYWTKDTCNFPASVAGLVGALAGGGAGGAGAGAGQPGGSGAVGGGGGAATGRSLDVASAVSVDPGDAVVRSYFDSISRNLTLVTLSYNVNMFFIEAIQEVTAFMESWSVYSTQHRLFQQRELEGLVRLIPPSSASSGGGGAGAGNSPGGSTSGGGGGVGKVQRLLPTAFFDQKLEFYNWLAANVRAKPPHKDIRFIRIECEPLIQAIRFEFVPLGPGGLGQAAQGQRRAGQSRARAQAAGRD